LQIETQAPNAPVLSLDAANDTGLTGDNTTNQSSVTIDVSAETAGGMVVNSPLSGGRAEIGGNSSIEFPGGSQAAVSFDGGAVPSTAGMLKLDLSAAGAFDGTIAGARATVAYAANGVGTGGTLTVSDGTHTASLALLGQYAAADEHGGTLLTLSDPSENHLLAPGT
jgi:hypothetical protein